MKTGKKITKIKVKKPADGAVSEKKKENTVVQKIGAEKESTADTDFHHEHSFKNRVTKS